MSFFSNLLLKGIENPKYTVLDKFGDYELRKYAPMIVAETVVDGTQETAGNSAFGILAGYIFGKNVNESKISMTAPVSQQQVGQGKFVVQFMMPSEWSLQTLPAPKDQRVTIKSLPERIMAVHRYTGGWSQELYEEEMRKFAGFLQTKNLKFK